jgi:hypothetical protein
MAKSTNENDNEKIHDLERIGEYVIDEDKLRLRLGLSPHAVLRKDARGRVLIPRKPILSGQGQG